MAKITWTFKNEEGTNLNRYIATNVSTGEKITFDLLRGGNISVVGTPLNAENLNALITAINACYDLISSSEKDTTYTLSKNGNAIRLTSSDGTTNDVTLDKSNVGLGNVDNTSDKEKPISDATQQGLNKPLYNLGAFDTISGNVITRQTGYVDLGTLDGWKSENVRLNDGNTTLSWYAPVPNALGNFDTYGTTTKCNKYKNNQSSNVWFNKSLRFGASTTNINVVDTDFNNYTATQVKSALNGVLLQYKLANPYTEEIIEGQPLITLDSQGSQWLRSEWEKGLNLFDFTTANPNYYKSGVIRGDANVNNNGTIIVGVDASSDYGRGFKIQVKANTTYIFSFTKNIADILFVEAFQNNTSIKLNSFTTSSRLSLTFTTNDSSDFVVLGFSTTVSAIGNLTISDLMLNYGDHAYPYQPYNSKAHITNYEADFLKDESLKSANLFDKDNVVVGDINSTNGVLTNTTGFMASDYIEIKPNTTYSNNLKIKSFSSTGLAFYDSNKNYISGIINNSSAYNKFTTPSNAKYLRITIDTNYSQPYDDINNVMLNEGTEPLPYQEYNGSIVREKQLNELDNKKANNSDLSQVAKSGSYNDLSDKPTIPTVNYPVTSVNGKTGAVDLNAGDVGARPSDWTPSKTDLGLGNVDNTSDSEKEVASAKILKNNDIGSFTLSSGFTSEINFNSNSVYLIYDSHWNFIIRIGDKSKNSYVKSTVCYDDNSKSKPLWFYYENNPTTGLRLYLKTLSDTSYIQTYSYNGTFNYKLLSTD